MHPSRGRVLKRLSALLLPAMVAVACAGASLKGDQVTEKLDPDLKARIEALGAGGGIEAADTIEVLIGLDRPASDADLAGLKAAGLTVRSVIGDVLTGTIPAGQVASVAANARVVKIEASRALQQERPPTD